MLYGIGVEIYFIYLREGGNHFDGIEYIEYTKQNNKSI